MDTEEVSEEKLLAEKEKRIVCTTNPPF